METPQAGLYPSQQRRLPYQHRLDGRIHTRPCPPVLQAFPSVRLERPPIPVPSTSIRYVPFADGVHQGNSTGTSLGSPQRHSFERLSRRLAYCGQGSSHIQPTYQDGASEASRPRFPGENGEVFPPPITVDPTPGFHHQFSGLDSDSTQIQGARPPSRSLTPSAQFHVFSTVPRIIHWKGTVYDNGRFSGPNANPTIASSQNPCTETIQVVELSAGFADLCERGTFVVDRPLAILERPMLPSDDPTSGNLHGCLQLGMGNRGGPKLLEWPLDTGGSGTPHQPERTVGHLESSDVTPMDGQEHPHNVRQYDDHRLCEQVRLDSVSSPSPTGSPDMEFLPEDEHETSPSLCGLTLQSSGCTIPSYDSSIGVAHMPQVLPTIGGQMGSPHDRHVRSSVQPPSPTPCNLEVGPSRSDDGCHVVQLEVLREVIPLSSLESSSPGDRQDPARTDSRDINHAVVAKGDMVLNVAGNSTPTASEDTPPNGPTTNRISRKRPAAESALVADRLNHKIRRLEEAGADTNVTNAIMQANPRRYLRYAQVQAKFVGWCSEQSLDFSQPASVLNFLAHGHTNLQWSLQTLLNYRSSIADMFDDRASIIEFWPLRTFFQAVQETTLRQIQSRPVDISPIVNHFHSLGSNHSLPLPDLTAKLCWLLGVCGFMRPSNIERIDLDQSSTSHFDDRIVLIVVAPKEKRLSQRIQKEIVIRQHSDSFLCPVAAVRHYIHRHARRPCHFPHPILPHVNLNYLVRDIRDCHKPIYAQRISNHINSIMTLLPDSNSKGRLRARALDSTRALLAGATTDAIVSHGNWSSQSIFNNYYRLSTETQTDFTSLVLGSSGSSSASLEPQSLVPQHEV